MFNNIQLQRVYSTYHKPTNERLEYTEKSVQHDTKLQRNLTAKCALDMLDTLSEENKIRKIDCTAGRE